MFACGNVPAMWMGQGSHPTLGLRGWHATWPSTTAHAGSGSPQQLPSWYEAGSARQSEELRRRSACLNALPAEGRRIVLLAHHYGLTREEVSKRVDEALAMVRSSLRRSLAQLKECLGR